MSTRFRRALGVLVVLGLIQAAVETAVIAVLYRDLLFAPYRFFSIQLYDASTKLYFWLAEFLPLPVVLAEFVGQGLLAKATLFPELAAINVFIAAIMALVLVPVAGGEKSPIRRIVVVATIAAVALHLVQWVVGTKLPVDPTPGGVVANLARSAFYDGAVFAVGVSLLSALTGMLVLGRGRAVARAVATVVVIAAAALPMLAGAQHGVQAVEGRGERAPAYGYNVVLVSIDSLRADRMSLHGHDRETTPAMTQLARDGMYFENCRSTTSWTLPAHMSLLTGRSLLGHGVVSDDRRLSRDVPTLAESFSRAGYTTGAVVSAPYLESRYGFARGFDTYDDETVSFATNNESYKSVTAPLVNTTAGKWMAEHGDKPFFLFLHYWDVHYDYAPGPPYDTMFDPDYDGDIDGADFYFNPAVNADMDERDLEHVLALYDGEIRLVDDHIGKLRAALDRLGIADRTMVVVTADHGDEFFEHGRKGHHRTLYDEVLRVPLIVYVPKMRPAAYSIADTASIVDVMPTVLGLAGVELPPGLEGVDFTDRITGNGVVPARSVFGELYRKGSLIVDVAAVDESSKVIHHFNHRSLETFDLAADPGEHRHLANTEGEAPRMVALLQDWLAGRWKVFDGRVQRDGVDTLELDQQSEDALRALGYVE